MESFFVALHPKLDFEEWRYILFPIYPHVRSIWKPMML